MFKQSILLCLAILNFGTILVQKNATEAGKFTVEYPIFTQPRFRVVNFRR